MKSLNSFHSKSELKIGNKVYHYFNLPKAAKALGIELSRLPYSLRVLLENLLRFEDNKAVKKGDIEAIASWLANKKAGKEISFHPSRVLMQDFTGVPAVVDLAAMRDAMHKKGGDSRKINPLVPVHLVIDHSVQVDKYGNKEAFMRNVELEMQRNKERYEFLRWGQEAFNNFKVVPPGTGICHQVNLEYLAKVVWQNEEDGKIWAYPDSLVGTDSHTTMINGLSVLGWGVGGIEAEAAMLGQPITMLIPEVIGFKLSGRLKEGTTATDLVLSVTQILRAKGVVGKFVEFFGPGLSNLPLADRATIANMAPEYGATCGFFPIDEETIKYLELSGRDKSVLELVEHYAKEQNMWRDDQRDPEFTDILELDLSQVEPSLAGPKRPQDRVNLKDMSKSYQDALPSLVKKNLSLEKIAEVKGSNYKLGNGDLVIAAITSCTNTSNPSVMIAAGLVARKARALGIKPAPWVKTSLAPGSKVVSDYLERSGLQEDLDAIGFNLVGYGCTTCIGNSGPLLPEIEEAINGSDIAVASVLSGNRNFEGRVHPLSKANYLASPPLVVAYSLAGNINLDLQKDVIAHTPAGKPVYLKDVWPSNDEIAEYVAKYVNAEMFSSRYADVFKGDQEWQNIKVASSLTYPWNKTSTYINNPPYFIKDSRPAALLKEAKILAVLGDSVTTDHISPAGNIAKNSPAAKYLQEHNIEPRDFNSYGSRRGNHEVMMRGTFANIRIRNEMVPGVEGGYTSYKGEVMSIYDAAMEYQKEGQPLVIIAGKEYGTGSSRDWAAKGTKLLGVGAVIAESFERIHRSNLVGMGVLPLQFTGSDNRKSLGITGKERVTIADIDKVKPGAKLKCMVHFEDGKNKEIECLCRIDTENEVEYFRSGGILQYVLDQLA